MKTFARLLLVAFALAAGCATEDIDSPEPENGAATTPAPAADEPVAPDESAVHALCGGRPCDGFHMGCCNNRCVSYRPGDFCMSQNAGAINE
jgi:hypothetical protein